MNANILADATNVTLKEIINIDYSFSEVVFNSREYNLEAIVKELAMSMPDVEPENIDGSKNVTIIWRIE